jgi:PAS domain S-box-containing protein
MGDSARDGKLTAEVGPVPDRSPALVRAIRSISTWLAGASVALGVAVLLGWALEVPVLKSGHPGLPPMRPNAALAFILIGAGLVLRRRERTRRLAVVLACVALAVGLATSLEWALDVDLGIDELLFRCGPLDGFAHPGRMSFNAAAGFSLLGLALAWLDARPALRRIAGALSAVAAVLALLAVAGHVYSVPTWNRLGFHTAITLHAAIGLLALAVAALLARGDAYLAEILASDSAGGILLRRALPLVVTLPLALELVSRLGVRAGLYDARYDEAARAVLLVTALVWLTIALARRLDAIDRQRRSIGARLAGSENQLRQLFENMSSGFAVHRMVFEGDRPTDYVFLQANRAFEEQTGLQREQIIGKRVSEVMPGFADRHPEFLQDYGDVVTSGRSSRFERYAPALQRWYAVSAYRFAPWHFATVFDDITQQKRSEREIADLNAGLQRRARDLAAANAELEGFSYSVAHDLRSPLRSIAGFSQAAIEEYGDRLDATGREYLRLAREGSLQMARLIDDLLSLAHVAQVEAKRERVDLAAVAREVAADLRRAEPGREVAFDIEPGLVAHCDPSLLRVALQNVLGNSWKFTSRHPSARIAVGSVPSRGRQVFCVSDDGAGFDMAYAHRLTRPFQRLHSVEQFPGNGIGLAIVDRIVRRHGGELWVEGAVENGARVYFHLPGESNGV